MINCKEKKTQCISLHIEQDFPEPEMITSRPDCFY